MKYVKVYKQFIDRKTKEIKRICQMTNTSKLVLFVQNKKGQWVAKKRFDKMPSGIQNECERLRLSWRKPVDEKSRFVTSKEYKIAHNGGGVRTAVYYDNKRKKERQAKRRPATRQEMKLRQEIKARWDAEKSPKATNVSKREYKKIEPTVPTVSPLSFINKNK